MSFILSHLLIKPFMIISVFCIFVFKSLALTVTITANANFTFTPDPVNITEGDTICFVNISSFHPLVFNSNQSVVYTSDTCFVLAAGTHDYFCQNHVALGMTGTIVVSAATGFSFQDFTTNNYAGNTLVVYPNPFSGKTFLHFESTVPEIITIYNINGQKLELHYSTGNKSVVEIDFTGLPSGIYYCGIRYATGTNEIKKLVKLN